MTITPFNQSRIKIYNSICLNIYIFHIQICINQSIFVADIKQSSLHKTLKDVLTFTFSYKYPALFHLDKKTFSKIILSALNCVFISRNVNTDWRNRVFLPSLTAVISSWIGTVKVTASAWKYFIWINPSAHRLNI